MKLPGRAWLEFEVEPDGDGSVLQQTAVFDPVGLLGLVYWYSIFPLHGLIFGRMLANIAAAAESGAQGDREAVRERPAQGEGEEQPDLGVDRHAG